jgi:hypothetical protein
MMQEIGVRATDFGSDSLERDRLRTIFKKQPSCRFDRGRAALSGAQSFASC